MTPSLAHQLGLPDARGALVATTLVNSPAQRSGLKEGDVIITFNGHQIRDWKDLRNRTAEAQVGTPAKFTILRATKPLELSVVMEEEPTK